MAALSAQITGAADLLPDRNEEYATQIARDLNVKSSGSGYVERFAVYSTVLAKYPVHQVRNATHREYWIPAQDIEHFNDHIIGATELMSSLCS